MKIFANYLARYERMIIIILLYYDFYETFRNFLSKYIVIILFLGIYIPNIFVFLNVLGAKNLGRILFS